MLYLFASVFEILTLGAIVLSVRAIDPDQSVGISWIDHRLGTGTGTLVTVGVILFTTQTGAATLHYLSARAVRKLGRLLNHELAQGLISAVADQSSNLSGLASKLDRQELLQTANTDTKMAGLSMLTLFSVTKASVLSLVYGWALVAIAPTTTLALLPVALLALPLGMFLGRRVQDTSREFFMSSSRDYGIQVRDQLTAANQLPPIGVTGPVERDVQLEGVDVDRFYDDYDQVLLANEQTQLGASSLQGLAIAVALGALGRSALDGEIAFSTVLVYVLAVGRAAANARTAASHLTNLVRYHPMIRRLYDAMHTEDQLVVRSGLKQPPTRTSLVSTVGPLGRLEVARIRVGLATVGYDLPENILVVPGQAEIHPVRLREFIFSDESDGGATTPFAELMPSERLGRLAETAEIDWDYLLDEDGWAALAQALKVAIVFLRAVHRKQFLLISVGQTEGLDDGTWLELEELTDRVAFLSVTEGRPVRSGRFVDVFEQDKAALMTTRPFDEWLADRSPKSVEPTDVDFELF